MDNNIAKEILTSLYEAFFVGDTRSNLYELNKDNKWDKTMFQKTIDRIKHDNLIKPYSMGGHYVITPFGVVHTETEIKEPAELIDKNTKLRTDLLKMLYEEYDKYGIDGRLDYHRIKGNFDKDLFDPNLDILTDLNYINFPTSGCFSMTYKGLEAVEDWKKKVGVVDDFDSISKLPPQARGRKFQKLFSTLISQNGWLQEEGVKTSNEEMDVIIFKEREYYLTECKWEKEPIKASVIRELKGKLDNRIDVRGIAVSMSGFTSGAVKQVDDYRSQRVIVLFGPEDINDMLYQKRTFDDFLNNKYKNLVTKGEVIFR